MLYLTCTMISSVEFVRYGVSRAEDLRSWGFWYNFSLRRTTHLSNGITCSLEDDQMPR